MSARPVLLLVGHDSALNRTRSLILERYFSVLQGNTLAEVAAVIAAERPALMLICYSLSEREAHALIDLIHERSPQTRALALAHGYQRLRLSPPDEEYLLGTPDDLLRKAAAMTGIRIAIPPGPQALTSSKLP